MAKRLLIHYIILLARLQQLCNKMSENVRNLECGVLKTCLPRCCATLYSAHLKFSTHCPNTFHWIVNFSRQWRKTCPCDPSSDTNVQCHSFISGQFRTDHRDQLSIWCNFQEDSLPQSVGQSVCLSVTNGFLRDSRKLPSRARRTHTHARDTPVTLPVASRL